MNSTTYSKGRYQAKVLDQGFEKSAAKGTPYFFLQFLILSGYGTDGQLQECPRYERTYRQYLNTETGVSIFRGDLKTLGVQISDLAQLDPGSPNHVTLVGRTIDVFCDLDSYQGKQVERWRIPRTGRKLSPDAVRAINDQFGHLLHDGSGQAQPAPAPKKSDAPL
jgi:hypothetical protein